MNQVPNDKATSYFSIKGRRHIRKLEELVSYCTFKRHPVELWMSSGRVKDVEVQGSVEDMEFFEQLVQQNWPNLKQEIKT